MELSEAEQALVARLEWEVSTPKVTGRRGRLVPVDTPRIFRMDLEKHCRELNLSPPSTIRRFIAHGLIAETDTCGNYFDITGKVLDAAAATLADPQKTPNVVADDEMGYDAKAVAMLAQHPDWTTKQIAGAIGCARETLYKPNMKNFKRAKAALKEGREAYRPESLRNWGKTDGCDRRRKPSNLNRREYDDD